jgi:transposase
MNYVGVDLHKNIIQICVVQLEGAKRKVICQRRFDCRAVTAILEFFKGLGPFQMVVEATASYEWFVKLVEPLADQVLLAHPKKLRIIAESTHKTDKIDARILAELLAVDMIPRAYRPTPRQREYRVLVRYRYSAQRRIVSLRNRIRRILANYNADCKELFSAAGLSYLAKVEVSAADHFVLTELVQQWEASRRWLYEADRRLVEFGQDERMPCAEREAREILSSFPCVGPVTVDVVLSELADATRFRSQKKSVSYAGLAPGIRQSAGKTKELHITKEGSRLLRWALIQTAWRLVNKTAYWWKIFDGLRSRTGKKKAIVAVARRILCVMTAMLQSGQRYRFGGPQVACTQESAPGLAPEGPKVEEETYMAGAPPTEPTESERVAPGRSTKKRAASAASPRTEGKRRRADPGSAPRPPSGSAPALGSHPCVALSSGQAITNRAHNTGRVKPPGATPV